MSHSTASSEWTDTGPLTAAIIGTSMASIWSTRRLPSQMMRSHTVALARPSASGLGPSPRPMNVSPVPVRITTRFSRSDAMALNSSGSSWWGGPPHINDLPRQCMRIVSTPASSRLTSAVEYRSLYSWSSTAASCHAAAASRRGGVRSQASGSPVIGGGMIVPRGRKIEWWRMRASSGHPGAPPPPTTSPSSTWYQWSLRS